MSGGALHNIVADYLRSRSGYPFTAEQIARELVDLHPTRFAKKEGSLGGREPLVFQLTREIYAQRKTIVGKHPDVTVDLSRRPLRFVVPALVTLPQPAGVIPQVELEPALDVEAEAEAAREEQSERSLYEPLQSFLTQEMQILTKRIRESTSKNRRGKHGNKWLHPDIVGMLAPGRHWSDVVRQCAMELPTKKATLVSIEVKLRLQGGNVRESFFQTVSNSLWANHAYLAAAEVVGEATWAELRTLCALHGIGFLSIDVENFSESRVLIPPREREEVDWASADRIAEENGDFREFLGSVLNYLRTGEVMSRIWDHAS